VSKTRFVIVNFAFFASFVKEVCNRAMTYQPALVRNCGVSIVAFLSKNDMDSVKKYLFGTSLDQKNVVKNLEINLAP
jgi:hypothetical protein